MDNSKDTTTGKSSATSQSKTSGQATAKDAAPAVDATSAAKSNASAQSTETASAILQRAVLGKFSERDEWLKRRADFTTELQAIEVSGKPISVKKSDELKRRAAEIKKSMPDSQKWGYRFHVQRHEFTAGAYLVQGKPQTEQEAREQYEKYCDDDLLTKIEAIPQSTSTTTEISPLTREQIITMGLESLSKAQARGALNLKARAIRGYFYNGKLDRTSKGRIKVNQKFWDLYNDTHGYPKLD